MPVDRSRLPPLGPDPAFRFPPVVKHRLDSGLQVWTVEHHALPVVCHLLVLPYGAAADPPHRPGLAALVADLLDEGAGDRSAVELSAALAAIGGQFEVEVGPDATFLTLTTLSWFVEDGLALMADMVARPRFEPDEFLRIRDLRLSRLRQLRSLPPALADRTFFEVLYRDHPYGHLALGTESSLVAVEHEEVVAFHRAMADPAAATLILVGDITPEAAAGVADRVFARWDGLRRDGSAAEPGSLDAVARPPHQLDPRPVLVHRPQAPQSELRLGHVAAPRNTPDYHALLVLNMVLGGQFTSRLNLKLREEKGLTYGARSLFDFRRGPGPFVVQVAVQADATAMAIEQIRAEVAGLRGDRPASEREVERARAALVRGYPRAFETAEQIARAVAQIVVYGLRDDEFSRFVPAVAAVGVEQVADVASRYLDPARLLPVIVGDGDLVAPLLAQSGLGEPVAVSMEGS